MKKFDVLIKDGYLVDAANRREGRFDIGLAAGKVMRVETEINPDQAKEIINARDKLVLPGLVDAHVQLTPRTRAVIYLEPADPIRYLKEMNFDVIVSFPVNSRATAFLTTTEKDKKGRFIIPALATDGGGIPRNFLLSHGRSLVRFDALTLTELVHKCCRAPAQMLGLPDKGHLAPGADADIVVVDPDKQQAALTAAGGKVIMVDGVINGKGGTIITTEQGKKNLTARGIPSAVADLADSLFYNAPETSTFY